MRNIIIKLSLVSLLIISGNTLFAQGGPPNPPPDANGPGGPVGGGAPIGGGIAILLSLSAAWGGKKIYQAFQNKELSDSQED